MKKKQALKIEASMILHGVSKMTRAERRALAAWIRSQSSYLLKHGDNFAPIYKARRWTRVNRGA